MELDKLWDLAQKVGVSEAARELGVSKQRIYARLKQHPEYKPVRTAHKATRISAHCPKCASTRTRRRGYRNDWQQYSCNECGYRWREKTKLVRASEIFEKGVDGLPNM